MNHQDDLTKYIKNHQGSNSDESWGGNSPHSDLVASKLRE